MLVSEASKFAAEHTNADPGKRSEDTQRLRPLFLKSLSQTNYRQKSITGAWFSIMSTMLQVHEGRLAWHRDSDQFPRGGNLGKQAYSRYCIVMIGPAIRVLVYGRAYDRAIISY
jgi:hypothetical protein